MKILILSVWIVWIFGTMLVGAFIIGKEERRSSERRCYELKQRQVAEGIRIRCPHCYAVNAHYSSICFDCGKELKVKLADDMKNWTGLTDSALKARLDIAFEEIEKALEKNKQMAMAICVMTFKERKEFYQQADYLDLEDKKHLVKIYSEYEHLDDQQSQRTGCLFFLFEIAFAKLLGVETSHDYPKYEEDKKDKKDKKDKAAEVEDIRQSYSKAISFVQSLKRSIDMNDADLHTCYQLIHTKFLFGSSVLIDAVLLEIAKACGTSFVEEGEDNRTLLSFLNTSLMPYQLRDAIKERIVKAEAASAEEISKENETCLKLNESNSNASKPEQTVKRQLAYWQCSYCGTMNKVSKTVCSSCGTSLKT